MTAPVRSRGLLLAAYAATWLIWGSTYLAIRYAVEVLPPFLMVAIRSLTAGVILVGWAIVRRHRAPTRGQWLAAIAAGALYFLIGHGGLFWAEQRVATGPAALMIATEHFWVVLLAWILPGGQAPSRRAAVGVLIGLAGVALLSLGGGKGTGLDPLGTAVLLVSSISWSAGALLFRGKRRPESPAYGSGMPLVAGGVMLFALSAALGEPGQVRAEHWTPLAMASLAYLIVFGSVIAFTAFTWLLDAVGPSRASSYVYINPFVAVLLGWAVLHEQVTGRVLLAGAAIVVAVLLIVKGSPAELPQTGGQTEPDIPARRRTAARV